MTTTRGISADCTTYCAASPDGAEVTNDCTALGADRSLCSSPERCAVVASNKRNQLFYGDNLQILRNYIADESVDLVYLDPPFNSKQDFNVIFKENDGKKSTSQELVFEDTWRWNEKANAMCRELVESGGRLADAIRALHTFLGNSDMMAYLVMIAPRLRELWRVLRPTGSIYLHCDPTASHYLKILMDAVFKPTCFRNEIIWSYRRWPSPAKHFQRMHDVLLFYAKSPDGPGTFNVSYEPNSPSYQKRFKGLTQVLDPESKTRKLTVDKPSRGLPMRDVWDIKIIPGSGRERLGYPTQKPEALLERIISASTKEGHIVLDPFCGCGTAVAMAQKLGRRWIGIDITCLATAIIKHRLASAFGFGVFKDVEVIGEPVTFSDAEALARDDKFGFQCWAVGRLGVPPIEHRKGADRGIDGRIYFHDDAGAPKQIIISVKGGEHIGPAFLRELRGVIERERAAMGIFVCLREPTAEMKREARGAGEYKSLGGAFPRVQIVTVNDIFADKPLNIPGRLNPYERKRPASASAPVAEQLRLLP